jgi:DNA-directed RNA polymerase specialized sigma24 family protein
MLSGAKRAVAWRILRDRDRCDDAVQECLIRAWRDLRGLRDADRFDAWLYRLLVDACRDESRRERRLLADSQTQFTTMPDRSDSGIATAGNDGCLGGL